MAFERLVRDDKFVSPLLTAAIGKLDLQRPESVRRHDCGGSVATTALALQTAHAKALEGAATLLTSLGVPFVGISEDVESTPVQPDFAIVASRHDRDGHVVGSWLIMGDAKDYERVRSRIDDNRVLKGFLQVAMGAESARTWSAVPDGQWIHRSGVLAVPRNAFLQPTAIVEDLSDHCREVRSRADERLQRLAEVGEIPLDESDVDGFVEHLVATFDPASCPTCALFRYCRDELRTSIDPMAVLIEIGVRPEHRAAVVAMVEGGEKTGQVPTAVAAQVRATVTGNVQWTGKRRVDPVGLAGTIEVVVAKSDSAALGVHGCAVRWIGDDDADPEWQIRVFEDPQSPSTRLGLMAMLGEAIEACLDEDPGRSIHIVVPDAVTADTLASMADSVAGVEVARLRWSRDVAAGRPPLTFDGEPATIPPPLTEHQRLAVSFLLEEDRARAMRLRTAVVDLRETLTTYLVAGGPTFDRGRLDYLVRWAEGDAADHRALSDEIAASDHTPGARLSNRISDAIHGAGKAAKPADRRDPEMYRTLVEQELGYKCDIVDRARSVLDASVAWSQLRPVHEALEADAQEVWRRRVSFHASDLVRFGRTGEFWRDDHVELLDADDACSTMLESIANPLVARDRAEDAGVREFALAEVVSVDPVRVIVHSRRIGDGQMVVALVQDHEALVESLDIAITPYGGHFRVAGLPAGSLRADDRTEHDRALAWECDDPSVLEIGAELVVVSTDAFKAANSRYVNIARPSRDMRSAPTADCHENSYSDDPEGHRWCCRSHEAAEADTADWIADRRSRGQMNPEVWPPVVDDDAFDIKTSAPADTDVADPVAVPEHLTMDDL